MANSSDNSDISDNSNVSDTSQTTEQSMKRQKREEVNNNIKNIVKNELNQNNGESEEVFKFSDNPTLEQIRQMHAKFCSDRNWDQFHSPRNVLLAFVAEMGELSECFQWKSRCDVGLKDWTPKERKGLEEELSDCLIYLLRLADRCRVDLPTAVVQKLAKNEAKYPIDKVFGSSKKYTEYQ